MRSRLRVFVPLLLLAASACSRSGGGQAAPAPDSVTVGVTNNNALPMEVYAIGSEISHRMGTVLPGMKGHFVVPQTLIGNGSVEFEARPRGGGESFRSGEILLAPGVLLEFVIAAQLFNSTVDRRP